MNPNKTELVPIEHRADGWPLCPNCEEEEVYSLASGVNGITDYLQAGLACYVCSWRSDDPPRALKENDTIWLVRVDEALQNTWHGLAHAIRAIPFDQRRRITSYRFAEELRAGKYRWWRIAIET